MLLKCAHVKCCGTFWGRLTHGRWDAKLVYLPHLVPSFLTAIPVKRYMRPIGALQCPLIVHRRTGGTVSTSSRGGTTLWPHKTPAADHVGPRRTARGQGKPKEPVFPGLRCGRKLSHSSHSNTELDFSVCGFLGGLSAWIMTALTALSLLTRPGRP